MKGQVREWGQVGGLRWVGIKEAGGGAGGGRTA